MKNFLSAAVLAIAMLFCINQSEAAPQPMILDGGFNVVEMTTGTIAEGIVDPDVDFLALRSGPSTNYSLILRIPPGARVKIALRMGADYREQGYRDYNDKFCPVTYNGVNGYAHRDYIRIIPGTYRDIP